MDISLNSIGTIRSPYCDLVDMPVQPKGAKGVFATIEFDKEFKEGLKDLDGFFTCLSDLLFS